MEVSRGVGTAGADRDRELCSSQRRNPASKGLPLRMCKFTSSVKLIHRCFIIFDATVNRICCCSLTRVQRFVTPWAAAHQASLSSTIPCSLLKLMSIELVKLSHHLIFCHPFLLMPSTFPSIRVFSKESVLRIRWPKYWSFSFSISPSNEYSGLIFFRTDWFDLLAIHSRDSQESSPAPHFKSINSSVLSLFHSPTLTSVHDHRKNHSLD